MKHLFTLTVLTLFMSGFLSAQEKQTFKATEFGELPKAISVPSIASQIENGTFIGVDENAPIKDGHPKRRWGNNIIPGKGSSDDDALVANQKSAVKKNGREPLMVFDADNSNATPSDPTGAVGPNHFIGAWNSAFRIFDKEGNPLTSEASLSTLFPGNNLGDPIVLYDVEADRFIITEFDNSPNGFNVAICQGPDPVNDGWHVYTSGFNTGSFPDYTKFSIWSDGYYVTANIGASNKVFVVERDEMLQGNASQFVALPLPGISTSGFYSPQFFNVTNGDLPPEGNAYVVYLQDDAWSGVSTDHLKLWTVNVDWENTSNSSISSAAQIITTPFISVFDGGSFSNRPQPSGPNQDVLQATIMNQAQYRRFDGYNSALFNFVVDTDGSSGELAGVRWYELRQYGDEAEWEIYQEGTYISPYNGKDAFSASMAMDGSGNIGMGYTTVSSTERIAINYTGRYASDPLGQMTIDETLIAQSTGNNPSNRLADYVHLTLDPSNDKTFWHIAEYFNTSRKDVVGVFQIAPDYQNDIGIASIDSPEDGALTANEDVTVTIFNGGEAEQSNIDVSYQIDGGEVITETFEGVLAPQAYESFTFSQTADLSNMGQTYEFKAFTSLDGDEDLQNDTTTKLVKHYGPTDLGVSFIIQPTSGDNLSSEEVVTVEVVNYGTAEQSNISVSYDIEGSSITESIPGSLAFNESTEYSFAELADLSAPGVHYIKAFTSLAADVDPLNDTAYRTVFNSDCIPEATCSGGHEIKLVQIGSINNASGCSENAYGDYADIMTDLDVNSINEFTIGGSYGNQQVKVWIDFNDNFVFDPEEVVAGFELADGENEGDFTQTEDLIIPEGATLGEHMMRVKLAWLNPLGDDGACDPMPNGGETEDYMVNILQPVGLADLHIANADLKIADLGNNQFKVIMSTDEYNEPMRIDVHNTMGQCVLHNRVAKQGSTYTYHLDMSYAQKGMYIIRFGSDEYGKVRKILVK
jgi:hypothetical protein